MLISKLKSNDIPIINFEDIGEWISQVEFLFKINFIRDPLRKLQLIGPQIPSSVFSKIKDPTQHTYAELLKILIEKYAPSDKEKAENLFQQELKAGEKPSEYLHRIQSSLGATSYEMIMIQNPNLMKEMFIRVLPQNLRPLLKVLSGDAPIDKLAEAADTFFEANGSRLTFPIYPVNLVKSPRPTQERDPSPFYKDTVARHLEQLSRDMLEIKTTVVDLHVKVQHLEMQAAQAGQGHQCCSERPPRYRTRTRSPSNYRRDGALCYFHFKFKEKATTCQGGGCKMAHMMAQAPSTTSGSPARNLSQGQGN